MIVINSHGEKIYGVVDEHKYKNGNVGYTIDNNLAAQEFIADNIQVLKKIISDYKEQDK